MSKNKGPVVTCPYCEWTANHQRAAQGRAAHIRTRHPDQPFVPLADVATNDPTSTAPVRQKVFLPRETKLEIVKKYRAGTPLRDLIKEYGAERSMIFRWAKGKGLGDPKGYKPTNGTAAVAPTPGPELDSPNFVNHQPEPFISKQRMSLREHIEAAITDLTREAADLRHELERIQEIARDLAIKEREIQIMQQALEAIIAPPKPTVTPAPAPLAPAFGPLQPEAS